ncbi:MAG: pyridoxamine 5'-phosphate oxidase family protein [Minwuia sp.]|nr:pyridoxamine 5'-phosphate oxidase family protein [Minwuia sp.]
MKLNGPWNRTRIDAFLTSTTVPMRLAAITGSGRPMLVSVWFSWEADALWCASPMQADIVRALRHNSACAFEVSVEAPPYYGVRGQGQAEILPDGKDQLRDLIIRYGGDPESDFAKWLLGRKVEEATLRITPDRLSTWDFRKRMGDAFD